MTKGMGNYMDDYRHLVEYTTDGSYTIDEAEGDDENLDVFGGNDEPQMGSQGNMGGMPQDMGAQMGSQGNMGGMPQDMGVQMGDQGDMGGMPQDMDANGPEGFNPEVPADGEAQGELDPNIEQEGDEVIDVDDLTNSQEDTERKIDKLSSKFEKLMQKLGDISDMIDNQNSKIENFEKEMEKRNPTPVEKMTLRSKNAYPFNVTPEDYWAEKEQNSNYSTEPDNNGVDDEVYQITKSDVDNMTDWNGISKSLDNRGYSLEDILDF